MKKCVVLVALATLGLADRIAVIEVDGMTCPLCTVAVKRSLKKTPGVVKAKVRLNTRRATVRVRDDVNESALLEAVKKTGYKGRIVTIEPVR